jgi:exodeoxyribonuclease-5
MKLNNDQARLLKSLMDWWEDPDQKFFVLSGQAGVGKTTCMKYLNKLLRKQDSSIKICMSAPTNKAVAVLSDSVSDSSVVFKTTYSILGLRMQANGEVKELTDSGDEKITDFDIVIIDEGSMINTTLIKYLLKKTALSDTKIVFIGDKEQLPPVGEASSPIWTHFELDYELTEVMRHQNSILDFVQSIRANPYPKFTSPGKQVFIESETSFVSNIVEMANQGYFHEGKAKAIAWRNVTVDFLNTLIRSNNSKTKSPEKYVPGDRVVFREPVTVGDRVVASTDEEGSVESVVVSHHTLYPILKSWKVGVRMDWTQQYVEAHIIHDSSLEHLQGFLDEYKTAKRWDLFWKLKESFHNMSYSYALTAHRSQGSTFDYVFVDAGDIMLNRNVDERTKCLYVGCSRASKELRVFP